MQRPQLGCIVWLSANAGFKNDRKVRILGNCVKFTQAKDQLLRLESGRKRVKHTDEILLIVTLRDYPCFAMGDFWNHV